MLFADGDTDPALAPEDLDVLVTMCSIVDINGVMPSDTSWDPTFNINYGIAQAWLVKAARTANRYLFMTGGKMLSRQQYFDHCMKMHQKFLSRGQVMAIRFTPDSDLLPYAVENNWNAGI